MAKACRTCESCYPFYGCLVEDMPLDCINTGACTEHKPRETPLLMDALAEALYWLLNLHHGVSKGGPRFPVVDREWEEALDAGKRIHARYQKEVDDGEDV